MGGPHLKRIGAVLFLCAGVVVANGYARKAPEVSISRATGLVRNRYERYMRGEWR